MERPVFFMRKEPQMIENSYNFSIIISELGCYRPIPDNIRPYAIHLFYFFEEQKSPRKTILRRHTYENLAP